MDYKELAEDALKSAKTLKSVAGRMEFYAAAITDLLARAEAAEARAEKAERERDKYKLFFDDVVVKPDCNDCADLKCQYRPKPGEVTRFNCPLWRG